MSRAQNSLLSAKTFRIAAAAAGVAGLILLCLAAVPMARAQDAAAPPILIPDKAEYSPGEAIVFTGANWQPGEAVTIVLCADSGAEGGTLDAVADASGSFTITVAAPEAEAGREGRGLESVREASEAYMATASGAASPTTAQARFIEGHAKTDGEKLLEQEAYWGDRQGFPTGRVNPQWLRRAARQDAQIERRNPDGRSARISTQSLKASPLGLNNAAFTALGPQPERMTGCSGCYDYTTTAGRINSIVVDPTTTTNGSIVAYSASVGGGVWKTTNCCSAATTWTVKTDDPLISTTSIDSLTIDPNDHNTIYAGTGDLNYGSFSMGSQGILKSTDAGATWTVLGADVFGAMLPEPPGQFPQYQSVGKVRVDPNDSNKVVAGTKTGLYISYNGGTDWTGPCLTNSFTSMRQDITGLELSNIGGTTRIIAAVGVRGFATTVQYNLGQNGANGLYTGTVPASGCPTDFVSIASNTNGFRYGPATTTYALNANMNAGSGVAYVNSSTGDQLGRIDIGVAPSNPDVIYAQVQSIAANSNSGCGSTNGCQLGAWVTTNGGTSWTFMTGSAGQSLLACGSGAGSSGTGDYPQNWYDQGVVVDPNNPDRVFFDTFEVWLATRTGTAWYDTTCGYTGVSPKPVHVDQHALAFVPGSSSLLLVGNDGGIHGTANANAAALNTLRPTWFNMDGGLNTIEFYSGDISGNFATAANPQVNGGAQDNGPSSATFSGSPTGPIQWQMGLGGDGFFARIDPVGTGSSLRFWQGNNSGGLSRCISNCTNSGATWTSKRGAWTGDQQSFILPFDIFHGDPGNPANDCGVAGAGTGCNHLIAGTVRVWETVTGAASGTGGTVTWYVNSPANLTKGTLGNRSFINQLTFEPKDQNTVIVGTNDANVQIGYGMGTGSGPTRAAGAITLTTGGALEGETFVIGPQTFTWQAAARTSTGQVQINSSTTTAGTNIVNAITADLAGVVTASRSGAVVTVTAANTGVAGNSIAFTEASTNMTMNGSGTLGGTTLGADGATWVDVTDGNTVLPLRPVLDVAFDPTTTTAPIAYAAVGGFNDNTPTTPGHVFRVDCDTHCGSFTWTDKSGNLPDIPVDSIIANPNFPQQVFAGTDFGLYYTDNVNHASPIWYRFSAGLPAVMIWDMQIDRGATTLSLWTRSRGAYAWPLPSGPINNHAPTMKCKNVTVSAGPTCTADADVNDGSFDPDDDPITPTQDPPGPYSLGDTNVTLSATDPYGATSSCTAVVTVKDTTNPVVSCPPNVVTGNDPNQCSAVVDPGTATATDNCSVASVQGVRSDGLALNAPYPVGVTTITWTATDGSTNTDSCDQTVTVNNSSSLSPENVWIGLKNSDDVGTNFDLLAEVFRNGAPFGSGQINNVSGGSSGFNNAVQRAIDLALSIPNTTICAGDTLSIRLSVRIGATGHRSGTARLWYNDGQANSRFGINVGGASNVFYLLSGSALGTSAGPGPKLTIDVTADRAKNGNPFIPFGTWSKTF